MLVHNTPTELELLVAVAGTRLVIDKAKGSLTDADMVEALGYVIASYVAMTLTRPGELQSLLKAAIERVNGNKSPERN